MRAGLDSIQAKLKALQDEEHNLRKNLAQVGTKHRAQTSCSSSLSARRVNLPYEISGTNSKSPQEIDSPAETSRASLTFRRYATFVWSFKYASSRWPTDKRQLSSTYHPRLNDNGYVPNRFVLRPAKCCRRRRSFSKASERRPILLSS